MKRNPIFRPGTNISIKTPYHTYDATISFYKDLIGLELLEETESSTVFNFGSINLWIDKVSNLSHPDVWLELHTDDINKTNQYLGDNVERRDEVEDLPPNFFGFWISSPNGIIHLILEDKELKKSSESISSK